MEHPGKTFYEDWAKREFEDIHREPTLKWKAVNLANLFLRSLQERPVASICEVGGAEGIILNSLGLILGTERLVNYELSTEFCQAGKEKYPGIEFINAEFAGQQQFDLIILSDIVEHIQDDVAFLDLISRNCRLALMKIPLEVCVTTSAWYHRLRGRSKPLNQQYGPQHENGHLHGYTLGTARFLVTRSFHILDQLISDVLYFGASSRQRWIRDNLGGTLSVQLFGGAFFILAESKAHS
jgi:phospholipid N-methyltransferase